MRFAVAMERIRFTKGSSGKDVQRKSPRVLCNADGPSQTLLLSDSNHVLGLIE